MIADIQYVKAKKLVDIIDEHELKPWQVEALDRCLNDAIAIVRDDRRRADRRRA